MTTTAAQVSALRSDPDQLYVSLWLVGLERGRDTTLSLPGWLSEGAETLLVLFKPFADA